MVKTVVANGRSLKEWVDITKLDPSLHFSINNHSKECYFESIMTSAIDSTMQTNQSDSKSPLKSAFVLDGDSLSLSLHSLDKSQNT